MMYTYKGYSFSIEDNKVSLWMNIHNPEVDAPSIFQDFNPKTGVPFESEEEAKSWIETFIENNYVNPKIPPYPPYIRALLLKPIEELALLPEEVKVQLPEDIQAKIALLPTMTPAPVVEEPTDTPVTE